ncbi:GM12443 [Drosophila sechellia]|uniref:GM12443 n=1 Tax=Drosophila sechellia TaxID=7238 RepID=B4I0I5_DROSE|nr:GM12443 [Drosophila sechellia]
MESPVCTSLSTLSELSLQSLGIGVAGKGQAKLKSETEIDAHDWQLLHHSIQPSIRKKSDLLIAVTHFSDHQGVQPALRHQLSSIRRKAVGWRMWDCV